METAVRILGFVCLCYWLGCTLRYTLRCSILYFWLLLGIFLVGASFLEEYFLWAMAPILLFAALFLLFLCWEFSPRTKPDSKPDAILVLGVRCDRTLPDSLLEGRVKLAGRLLEEYPDAPCILSGGKVFGECCPECETLYEALKEKSGDEKRILREEKSTTTKENFLHSFPLLPKKCGTLWVVTSAFHLPRAEILARSTNPPCKVEFLGAPGGALLLPHLYIREFFTFSVDLIRGNITPFRRSK